MPIQNYWRVVLLYCSKISKLGTKCNTQFSFCFFHQNNMLAALLKYLSNSLEKTFRVDLSLFYSFPIHEHHSGSYELGVNLYWYLWIRCNKINTCLSCFPEPSFDKLSLYTFIMMTSSNGNIFRVTGPLCGEFAGHRWIPLIKASDAELWCF